MGNGIADRVERGGAEVEKRKYLYGPSGRNAKGEAVYTKRNVANYDKAHPPTPTRKRAKRPKRSTKR